MLQISQIVDLFGKETSIKIEILSYLKKKKNWVLLDELSSELNMTTRTITKYLTFIEEDILSLSIPRFNWIITGVRATFYAMILLLL